MCVHSGKLYPLHTCHVIDETEDELEERKTKWAGCLPELQSPWLSLPRCRALGWKSYIAPAAIWQFSNWSDLVPMHTMCVHACTYAVGYHLCIPCQKFQILCCKDWLLVSSHELTQLSNVMINWRSTDHWFKQRTDRKENSKWNWSSMLDRGSSCPSSQISSTETALSNACSHLQQRI